MTESMVDEVALEGCLMKRSDTLKQWRKRWFRLRPHSMHLEYRKTAGDSTAHGLIALRHVCVGPLPSPSKHRDWFCFYVQGPTFTYWLAADAMDVASCWMDRINAAAACATAAALTWASHTPSIDGARSVYTSVDGRSSAGDFSTRSHTELGPKIGSSMEWPLGKEQCPEAPFNLSSGFFPWSDEIVDHRIGTSVVGPSGQEEEWDEKFTPVGSPSSAHFSASSVLHSTVPSSASSLARLETTRRGPGLKSVHGLMPTDLNSQFANDSNSRWFQVGRWWRSTNEESAPPWAKQYQQMAALVMEMRGLLDTKEQQLSVLQQTAAIDAQQLASANLRLEDVASKSQEELEALRSTIQSQGEKYAEEKADLVQQLSEATASIERLQEQLEEESKKSSELQSRIEMVTAEVAEQSNRATQAETEYARLVSVEERFTKLEKEASDLRKKLDSKEELLLRPFWGK